MFEGYLDRPAAKGGEIDSGRSRQRLQARAPLAERMVEERLAILVEEVEGEEADGESRQHAVG